MWKEAEAMSALGCFLQASPQLMTFALAVTVMLHVQEASAQAPCQQPPLFSLAWVAPHAKQAFIPPHSYHWTRELGWKHLQTLSITYRRKLRVLNLMCKPWPGLALPWLAYLPKHRPSPGTQYPACLNTPYGVHPGPVTRADFTVWKAL